MEHYFNLPVSYLDEQLVLKARMVTFGFNYKFYVIMDGKEVVLEKQDELEYRLANPDIDAKVNADQLASIICALQKLNW